MSLGMRVELPTAPGSSTYTVTHRDGCTLVSGSVPLADMGKLFQSAPKNAVISNQLAELTQSLAAFGPPDKVHALIDKLKPAALEIARRYLSHTTMSPQAVEWFAIGQHGISSCTIFSRITGVGEIMGTEDEGHPHDPDDLSRCRLLLEACPEIARELSRMAQVSPQWAALVERWDDLCALMDSEDPAWRTTPGSRFTQTARLMREIVG